MVPTGQTPPTPRPLHTAHPPLGPPALSLNSELLDEGETPIPGLYACGTTVPWCQSDVSANIGSRYAARAR